MSATTSRQFEITAESAVFKTVYAERKATIEKLPVVVWVKWPPIKEFARSVTQCDCQIGFEFIDTSENRAALRNAGMRPAYDSGNTLCLCFGRLIE